MVSKTIKSQLEFSWVLICCTIEVWPIMFASLLSYCSFSWMILHIYILYECLHACCMLMYMYKRNVSGAQHIKISRNLCTLPWGHFVHRKHAYRISQWWKCGNVQGLQSSIPYSDLKHNTHCRRFNMLISTVVKLANAHLHSMFHSKVSLWSTQCERSIYSHDDHPPLPPMLTKSAC